MGSTKEEMGKACERAWANRLRVEPIIERDLEANGVERDRKAEGIRRHKERMRTAKENKLSRAIKDLFP